MAMVVAVDCLSVVLVVVVGTGYWFVADFVEVVEVVWAKEAALVVEAGLAVGTAVVVEVVVVFEMVARLLVTVVVVLAVGKADSPNVALVVVTAGLVDSNYLSAVVDWYELVLQDLADPMHLLELAKNKYFNDYLF